MSPAKEGSVKYTTILEPGLAAETRAAGQILVGRQYLPPAKDGGTEPTKYGLAKYAFEMLIALLKHEEGIPEDVKLSVKTDEVGDGSPEEG